MSGGNPIRDVSDTALWVAIYRAMESERADAIFHDPYARRLGGERGQAIVDAMRTGKVKVLRHIDGGVPDSRPRSVIGAENDERRTLVVVREHFADFLVGPLPVALDDFA